MNTFKKIGAIALVTGLIFTSCDNKPENTETEIVRLADGTEVVIYTNNNGVVSFEDWDGYKIANDELAILEEVDNDFDLDNIDGLESVITNLEETTPGWLRTEEVMEDIEDVQEEYEKLLREKNEPMKNVLQNIEELNEKFDDFKEEINETIETYQTK